MFADYIMDVKDIQLLLIFKIKVIIRTTARSSYLI